MALHRLFQLSSLLGSAVRVTLRRNIGLSAVLFNKAKDLDPVQKLFLDKIREYNSKSKCVDDAALQWCVCVSQRFSRLSLSLSGLLQAVWWTQDRPIRRTCRRRWPNYSACTAEEIWPNSLSSTSQVSRTKICFSLNESDFIHTALFQTNQCSEYRQEQAIDARIKNNKWNKISDDKIKKLKSLTLKINNDKKNKIWISWC